MDELENMNRAEIGTLKEVITKSTLRVRKAYGHYNENLVRRASFMGSVNSGQFLNDPSGSRRFLAFEVTEIDFKHNVSIDMVYAQAFSLFKSGFKFFFEKDDIVKINSNNDQFNIRPLEEELLLSFFKKADPNKCNCFMTASEILTHISLHTRLPLTNATNISMGKMLKKHSFHQKKKQGRFVYCVEKLTISEVDNNTRNIDDDDFNSSPDDDVDKSDIDILRDDLPY
jgi:hypothetical protein